MSNLTELSKYFLKVAMEEFCWYPGCDNKEDLVLIENSEGSHLFCSEHRKECGGCGLLLDAFEAINAPMIEVKNELGREFVPVCETCTSRYFETCPNCDDKIDESEFVYNDDDELIGCKSCIKY